MEPATHLPSYGKVLNLGHRDLADLLRPGTFVTIQEKYDGSQFTWYWDPSGALICRSKGKQQFGPGDTVENADNLFRPAIAHLLSLDPVEQGKVIFRGETLKSTTHNTLTYGRVPNGFLVLFDAETETGGGFWDMPHLAAWAGLMGVDLAQVFLPPFEVADEGAREAWPTERIEADLFEDIIEKAESSLGGRIEGVVVKNYSLTNPRTGRPFLVGKVVDEHFKEVHKRSFKEKNPGPGDMVQAIINALNTEARFEKQVQHLAESGDLVNGPQDIGALMRSVKADVLEEERDWILRQLEAAFMPTIQRGIGRGLPEWYKARLGL